MGQNDPGEKAAQRVAEALQKTGAQRSHLGDVLKAFSAMRIEQARWKAELTTPLDCEDIAAPDPERFGKGIPLAGRERLCRLGDLWRTAVERLIPPVKEGFPTISGQIEKLQAAILDGSFLPDMLLAAALGGRNQVAQEMAADVDMDAELIGFILTELARPVVEKRAELLQPLINDLTWNKGYCPVCGSLPALSLLREKEGRRWLRCDFCAHTWRFHRTTCPFCDTQDVRDSEFFFIEGCQQERVEVCHKCKRYITAVDLRTFADEVVLEVADIALMHLDAIAQEKGFQPMKGSGWQGTDQTSSVTDANPETVSTDA